MVEAVTLPRLGVFEFERLRFLTLRAELLEGGLGMLRLLEAEALEIILFCDIVISCISEEKSPSIV